MPAEKKRPHFTRVDAPPSSDGDRRNAQWPSVIFVLGPQAKDIVEEIHEIFRDQKGPLMIPFCGYGIEDIRLFSLRERATVLVPLGETNTVPSLLHPWTVEYDRRDDPEDVAHQIATIFRQFLPEPAQARNRDDNTEERLREN